MDLSREPPQALPLPPRRLGRSRHHRPRQLHGLRAEDGGDGGRAVARRVHSQVRPRGVGARGARAAQEGRRGAEAEAAAGWPPLAVQLAVTPGLDAMQGGCCQRGHRRHPGGREARALVQLAGSGARFPPRAARHAAAGEVPRLGIAALGGHVSEGGARGGWGRGGRGMLGPVAVQGRPVRDASGRGGACGASGRRCRPCTGSVHERLRRPGGSRCRLGGHRGRG
mmetsp:Transcript_15261/g.44111  ORF Transcript_15261/g.44111 Transcript_15261/m.44111 type:complete len:225 (-) Transcript_15261:1443-2117(-)